MRTLIVHLEDACGAADVTQLGIAISQFRGVAMVMKGAGSWLPPLASIERLNINNSLISVRAQHVLANLGCKTIEDLTKLTRRDLQRAKHCGKGTLREIEVALVYVGHKLAEVLV